MTNGNQLSGFGRDLVTNGSVFLPNLLLKTYAIVGLTEIEMMVLIHLLRLRQLEKDYFPDAHKLENYMTIDAIVIKGIIAGLMEKNFLGVEPYFDLVLARWENAYSFDGLFQKLEEVWIAEKKHQNASRQKLRRAAGGVSAGATASHEVLPNLYKSFEKEFGRLLSPMETLQINEWYQQQNYKVELILEALKQAVLRGVLNFKYIGSILRDWSKNSVRTVHEALAYEEKFKSRRKLKNNEASLKEKIQNKKEKFKDIYLS
jgi:DNA replication protein